MNHLSWLIYLAGVVDNFRDVLAASFGLIGLGVVICLVNGCVIRDNSHKYDDVHKAAVKSQKTALIRGAIATAAVMLLMTVVPDKQTLYLIAGSEAGEQAVATPEFAKVRVIINRWLNKEAAPADPDKK